MVLQNTMIPTEFHGSRGLFLRLCASRSLDFSQSCLGVSSFFKAKKVPMSRIVFRSWLIYFYNKTPKGDSVGCLVLGA